MRRLVWNLLIATAVGVATYLASQWIWPKPGPRAAFRVPTHNNPNASGASSTALQFSPDGALLAACSSDIQGSRVFRVRDGKLVAEMSSFAQCAFAPKGDIFTFHQHSFLHVHDAQTGAFLGRPQINGQLLAVSIGEDGELYVGQFTGKDIVVQNLRTGQKMMQFVPGRKLDKALYWYHDRLPSRYMIVEKGEHLEFWEMSTGQVIGQIPANGDWMSPAFVVADGRFVVRVERDAIVKFDLTAKQPTRATFDSSRFAYAATHKYAPAISPDGKTAAVYTVENRSDNPDWFRKWMEKVGLIGRNADSGVIGLYDTNTCEEIATFPGAACVAFSLDGKTLAVANDKNEIEFWDLPLGPQGRPWWILGCATAAMTFVVLRWRGRRRKAESGHELRHSPGTAQ